MLNIQAKMQLKDNTEDNTEDNRTGKDYQHLIIDKHYYRARERENWKINDL